MFNQITKLAKISLISLLPFNSAQADEVASKDEVLVLPECSDSRGNEVVYLQDSFRNVVRAGGLMAYAEISDDTPYIVYETEFLGQFPVSFQTYVFAHECAHHVRGHLYDVIELAELNIQERVEDQADCDAIRYLVNNRDYGEVEISEIQMAWRDLIDIAKQQSPSTVPYIEAKPEKIGLCFAALS